MIPPSLTDREAMVLRPAATVAGSVNLLTAVRSKWTMDAAGNWITRPMVLSRTPAGLTEALATPALEPAP